MWALFIAELKRLWARPLLRRALLIGSVLAVGIGVTSNPEADAIGGVTMAASVRFVVPLVAVVFAATAAGSWCSSGTEQLLCQWTGSRGRLFVAEVAAVVIAAMGVSVTLFTETAATLLIRAAAQGSELAPHFEPLSARAGGLVLACLLGGSFGAGLGLLTRSSGASLTVVALLYVLLEPIVLSGARTAGIGVLLYPPISSLAAAGVMRSTDVGEVVSPDIALAASVGWVVLIVTAAALRMLRRDLS
ncbi:MAG: hypothetical protein N2037_09360 [Acidimicrobiales bacterium]|nr:hypothetical protein [Acidimicrobiales bacterium]